MAELRFCSSLHCVQNLNSVFCNYRFLIYKKASLAFFIFFLYYIKRKKESDEMLDFEEISRRLEQMQNKIKELGESL